MRLHKIVNIVVILANSTGSWQKVQLVGYCDCVCVGICGYIYIFNLP